MEASAAEACPGPSSNTEQVALTSSRPHLTTSQSLRLPSDSFSTQQQHEGDTIMLGSPFAGISSRPRRARGRHLASASLPTNEPHTFSSIDQLLDPFKDRVMGEP
jgi:hypothetical protein